MLHFSFLVQSIKESNKNRKKKNISKKTEKTTPKGSLLGKSNFSSVAKRGEH
jgi:hypothetical protein